MKQYQFLPVVYVGGMPISVEIVDASSTSDDVSYMGDACPSTLACRVAARTPGGNRYKHIAAMEATHNHELLHQISDVWNLKLTEDQVEGLAQALVQLNTQHGFHYLREI